MYEHDTTFDLKINVGHCARESDMIGTGWKMQG